MSEEQKPTIINQKNNQLKLGSVLGSTPTTSFIKTEIIRGPESLWIL
jgi:hypothetical protein